MTYILTYTNGQTTIATGNISLTEAQGYFTGNEYTVGIEKLICIKVEEAKWNINFNVIYIDTFINNYIHQNGNMVKFS